MKNDKKHLSLIVETLNIIFVFLWRKIFGKVQNYNRFFRSI